MQRLAFAGSADEQSASESERETYWSSAGTYFSAGLLGGGVVGAAALLALPLMTPGQSMFFRIEIPAAISALAHWVPDAPASRLGRPVVPVVAREPQPDAFDVVIDRGTRAHAPFALRLVGSEDTGMEVLLRDVPTTAVLSRGERRGLSTWALRAADLAELHLTLNDGTPDTFDVRIEVLAPAGIAAASSVARVRLVGVARVEQTASVPADVAPAVALAPVAPPVPVVAAVSADTPSHSRSASVASRNDAPKRERVARAALPAATTVVEIDRRPPQQAAPQAEARHWPEGASGLGAIARESDRQVWWKLPMPPWSPFTDMTSR